MSLSDRLLAALPGTQCGQCGYAGCRPFADALAGGDAQVEACAPAGAFEHTTLRRMLNLPAQPTLAEALAPFNPRRVAKVDESACIGCTKCLPACPVDALIGAPRQMHQVLGEACTGCGLCLPPCPVDCIELEPRDASVPDLLDTPEAERIRAAPGTACTHCGACLPVCPESLMPVEMLTPLVTLQGLETLSPALNACTGCGECDRVCPSAIPLSAWFVHGRRIASEAEVRMRESQRAAAASARRQRRTLKPPPRQSGFPDLAQLDAATAREELATLLDRSRLNEDQRGRMS